MKKIRPTIIPGIVWLALVTFLLTIPGNKLPQENWLDKIWFDKWVHIGLFSIMVLLFCWAITRKHKTDLGYLRKAFMYVVIAGLAYGIGMEFVQKYLVINRSFDGGDIIADGVGCALGLLYSSKRFIKK